MPEPKTPADERTSRPHEARRVTAAERARSDGHHGILTLEGGGVRGALTLEVLARIEEIAQAQGAETLSDHFDHFDDSDDIAGTITDAILATCLSLGWSVEHVRRFYDTRAEEMFDEDSLLRRLHHRHDADPLRELLQDEIGREANGDHVTLGSDRLKSLLMRVMRERDERLSMADLERPHGAIRRAPPRSRPSGDSAVAARAGEHRRARLFPARMRHRRQARVPVRRRRHHRRRQPVLPHHAVGDGRAVPTRLADGREGHPARLRRHGHQRDGRRRTRPGRHEHPLQREHPSVRADVRRAERTGLAVPDLRELPLRCAIDREVGDMCLANGSASRRAAADKLFTYVRYNADLSAGALAALGIDDASAGKVQKLDAVDGIPDLQRVGRAVAERDVRAAHFDGFAP